jgi:hypothetical protein
MNTWVDKKDKSYLTNEDSCIIAALYYDPDNLFSWDGHTAPNGSYQKTLRFTSLEKAKKFVERALNAS